MASVGTRVSDSTCITGQNPLNKDLLPTRTDQKINHPAGTLQPRNVGVEIQPVETAHFQRHVVFDNLGNVGHDRSSGWHQKRYHPTHVRDERRVRLGRAPAATPRGGPPERHATTFLTKLRLKPTCQP